MAIALEKVFAAISDYVQKHESNYTIIEDNINAILVQLGGASGSLSVPLGLQEIFDRDGVIGIASYQLTNQTVTGDNLSIPAGAAWTNLSFRSKTTSTTLITSALVTGERFINVDSGGFPSLSDSSTVESVYSFDWDSGTNIITNATLLIDILFDGDDYNDQLDSAFQSKSFLSVADRFEDIEAQLGVLGAMYAQDLGTTTGLTFGFQSGVVRNDNVIATTPAGTVGPLTDAVNNFIEVNPSDGVVSTNTTAFTTLRIPLFEATPSGGSITAGTVIDRRTWAALGGGGGGGGHAQDTDTGTSGESFTQNLLEAGSPTKNASWANKRGTSPTVDIRWNEDLDIWEFTNNGTDYAALGAPDLGVQELSKLVTFEDPPTVVDLAAQSSGAYIAVDLTADPDFTSIVSGVQGMLIRVQFEDTAATSLTEVLFRQIENPLFSPTESLRVLAKDDGDIDSERGVTLLLTGQGVDVGDDFVIGFEYKITASGAGTAKLKVFVLGYYEKVTGVGTQDVNFSSTGNVVAASTTVNFNIPAFANRALVHNIQFNEITGTPTGTYDIKVYKKDTFAAAELIYQVDDIDPTAGPPNWEDTLPWFQLDDDDTAELHVSINNKDGSDSGTYDITVRMERFD